MPAPKTEYPAHYAPPPVPAGSLSPVEMGALGGPDDSSQRPAVRLLSEKPTRRVGMALIAIGAMLGITFSLVQRTHHYAHARTAAAAAAVAPPEAKAPVFVVPPAAEAETAPTPAPVATVELDPASAPAVLVMPRAHHKAPPKATRTKAVKVTVKTKDEPKPGPKVEAPAPKPAPVVVKEAPKKLEPSAPAASPKLDDAANLLKAAKGATENTL